MEDKTFGDEETFKEIQVTTGPNRFSSSEGPIFALPHSCDEWVIGDMKEAEEFLKNLTAAIEYAKNNLSTNK